MPVLGLPSDNSSTAHQGPQSTPLAGQGHQTQASQSDGRRVSVSSIDSGSSLEHEKAQSQQALDQTSGPAVQNVVSEALQQKITSAEAALMRMLNRTNLDDVIEYGVERFIALELENISGMDRLVALEAMAFSQLSELLKIELVPLTKTVKYSAQPSGELRFVLEGPATQEQENEWEEKYHSLDEAVLRLVGTSGSAQVFNHGRRVASLEKVVAMTVFSGGRALLNGSAEMVGGYNENLQATRTQNVLQILGRHGDIERAPGGWLARAAKLEEVVLEALGFTPMTRSVAPANVPE